MAGQKNVTTFETILLLSIKTLLFFGDEYAIFTTLFSSEIVI